MGMGQLGKLGTASFDMILDETQLNLISETSLMSFRNTIIRTSIFIETSKQNVFNDFYKPHLNPQIKGHTIWSNTYTAVSAFNVLIYIHYSPTSPAYSPTLI